LEYRLPDAEGVAQSEAIARIAEENKRSNLDEIQWNVPSAFRSGKKKELLDSLARSKELTLIEKAQQVYESYIREGS